MILSPVAAGVSAAEEGGLWKNNQNVGSRTLEKEG